MRVNVYSQELTPEVVAVEKTSNTGIVYKAAQLVLHSSPLLHHPPADDDRSAVTFWLPGSAERRELLACAFENIAAIFRGEALPIEPPSPARGYLAQMAELHRRLEARDSEIAALRGALDHVRSTVGETVTDVLGDG